MGQVTEGTVQYLGLILLSVGPMTLATGTGGDAVRTEVCSRSCRGEVLTWDYGMLDDHPVPDILRLGR